MLPRGTLASAPHARTAHGRSAVRPRSLSDYVLPHQVTPKIRRQVTDRYTPGPAYPRSSMRSSYAACRRSADFVARDVVATCTHHDSCARVRRVNMAMRCGCRAGLGRFVLSTIFDYRFATGRSFSQRFPRPRFPAFSSVFPGPAAPPRSGSAERVAGQPARRPPPTKQSAPAPAPTPQSDRRHTRSPNQTRAHGLRDQPGL